MTKNEDEYDYSETQDIQLHPHNFILRNENVLALEEIARAIGRFIALQRSEERRYREQLANRPLTLVHSRDLKEVIEEGG